MTALRELSKEEYLATFVEPMQRLGEGDSRRPVSLRDYLARCMEKLGLPATGRQMRIQDAYLNGAGTHTHVLFHYGEPNRYLVLVVAQASNSVMGHYLLDLNAEYGL